MKEIQTYQNDNSTKLAVNLLEVLWLNKNWILKVTTFFLSISILINYFIIKPTYQAEAVLLASPMNTQEFELEGIEATIQNQMKYPDMNIDTYMQQIETPEVFQKVSQELGTHNESDRKLTPELLGNILEFSNPKGTDLIKVKAKHNSPEYAALVANTMSQTFIKVINDQIKANYKDALNVINERLQIEEQNIKGLSKELTKFNQQQGNMEEMKNDVESIAKQIGSFKIDLNLIENDIKIQTDSLEEYKKQGFNISLDLEEYKNKLGDSGMEQAMKIVTDIQSSVYSTVMAIKIARLETDLVENVAKQKALNKKITSLEKELDKKQTHLAEIDHDYKKVTTDLQLANQAYDSYKQLHKKATSIVEAENINGPISISSSAIKPTAPISPNRSLNTLIGALAGLALSMILVLGKQYLLQN